MGLEEKYLDELSHVELPIVAIDRQQEEMRDLHVIKALEALERHYRQLVVGKEPSLPNDMGEVELQVFTAVLYNLAEQSGGPDEAPPPARRSFSRALREPTRQEIYLACIRKVLKSAKFWTKERGERGYLDFVGGVV